MAATIIASVENTINPKRDRDICRVTACYESGWPYVMVTRLDDNTVISAHTILCPQHQMRVLNHVFPK